MPECHQCKRNAAAHARTGDCSICFASDVSFCAACAMWELGPKPTRADIFAELARDPRPLRVSVQRQHSEDDLDSVASVAHLPLDCDAFFPTISAACEYIEGQLDDSVADPGPTGAGPRPATLYGQSFKAYACSVLDKFRALYPACKYDRVALQVLLIMHLSSQERVQCRRAADREANSYCDEVEYLKRWQTRPIAVAHLRQHVDEIRAEFGDEVADLVGKQTWLDALGLDDFELYMKGLESPTLLAIDLLEKAGSADAARETLELAIILYHALTATRSKDELDNHWAQRATSFLPGEALGFYSKAHYETLYGTGGDGTSFSDETKARLNALWQVLGDASPGNRLPRHPRFPDGNVPGTLTAVEQNYLQYLPVFDHPDDEADQRPECEEIVRARVVRSVAAYREAYLEGAHIEKVFVDIVENGLAGKRGSPKYIKLSVPGKPVVSLAFAKLPGQKHARTDLAGPEQTKLDAFLRGITDPTYLAARTGALRILVTYETGNGRRDARRDLVLNAIRAALETDGARYWAQYSTDPTAIGHDGAVPAWDAEDYTDRMLEIMQDELYVDQCFDDALARLLMTNTNVVPRAWFPLKLRRKPYAEVFPACGFSDPGPALDVLDEHYEQITGTSARPPHYVDWRNHKDLWLYDCFAIDPRRRPLFCSLSLQPLVPEPNSNYGSHTLLFKRSTTRHRSVHTFGDKQQPRRSMLLLLDDIFYEHRKKDGSDGQSAANRATVADDLFRRVAMVEVHRGSSLDNQWTATLAAKAGRYPDGDLLIECQIFGPIDVRNDLLGFITWVESPATLAQYGLGARFYVDSGQVAAAQAHLSNHYSGRLLSYVPSQHHPDFMVRRRMGEVGGKAQRAAILDERAEDHT